MFTKEMAQENRQMAEEIRTMITADMNEGDIINTLKKQYPTIALDRIRRLVDKISRQKSSRYYAANQLCTIIPEAKGQTAPITRQAVHNLAKRHGWFTAYRGLYNKQLVDKYLEEIKNERTIYNYK